MFDSLAKRIRAGFDRLAGRGVLTEKNVAEGLREVRLALLEADVNYKVVQDFIQKVQAKALGEAVLKGVQPAQQIVKIVHDELVALMGPAEFAPPRGFSPLILMLCGLQGSGKTTTVGKLGNHLRGRGYRPLLVAADLQRPAAVDQLKTIGERLNLPVYAEAGATPLRVCANAIPHAREQGLDCVILDTAGRLHVDDELMREVSEIAAKVEPHLVYLVCDAMTGQDAVNSAAEFNRRLPLTGVILTKLDGDQRGGAALSVKAVTGKPIHFAGIGEGLDRIEEFSPERMAGRILGMGDVVGLVERAQQHVTQEEAQALRQKFVENTLTLNDLMEQLERVEKMGSFKEMLSMLPGIGGEMEKMDFEDQDIARQKAMIQSMTPSERIYPEIIDLSRRLRIARGSGTAPQEVDGLLRQFVKMKQEIRKKRGLLGLLASGMRPEEMARAEELMRDQAKPRRAPVDRKKLREKRRRERTARRRNR